MIYTHNHSHLASCSCVIISCVCNFLSVLCYHILCVIDVPYCLISSQADVCDFLYTLNLNRDNYQLGTTKIFLRESEKVKLDYRLHQQIMASIVTIQRWTRAVLERRRFFRLREAVILIQVRAFCHHPCVNDADRMTLYSLHVS